MNYSAPESPDVEGGKERGREGEREREREREREQMPRRERGKGQGVKDRVGEKCSNGEEKRWEE